MTRMMNGTHGRVWLAIAAVLLLSSAAWSNTVRLKRAAVVEPEQRVLLSDIADLDGAYAIRLAGTVIERRGGDLLGASGAGEIALNAVREVLRREGAVLGRLEFSGSVCRVRSSESARPAPEAKGREAAPEAPWRTIEDWRSATEQTIEIAIVRRFMSELEVPAERVRLRFEDGSGALLARPTAEMRTVVRPATALATGTVLFRIERYDGNGSLVHRDSVKVEAQVLRTVLKVREQISRREVVQSGLLEPSEEWLSPAIDAAEASELAQLTGRIAQTRLMPGDIVLRSQLEEPIAIGRNALVEVVYHGQGFVLKARGRARQAGRVGELIEVRVEDSDSSVLARVDGPGRVIVVQ